MTNLKPTLEKNYLTLDGDVVDRICWIFYGVSRGATEAVFARNPILSAFPSVLPAGVIIILPRFVYEQDRKPLWDYVQEQVVIPTPSKAFEESIKNDRLALEEFRRNGSKEIFIGFRPKDLYTPESSIIPVIIGDDDITEVAIPPTVIGGNTYPPPEVEEFEYVSVYYRTPDNVLKIGYVRKEAFDDRTTDEVLVRGRV